LQKYLDRSPQIVHNVSNKDRIVAQKPLSQQDVLCEKFRLFPAIIFQYYIIPFRKKCHAGIATEQSRRFLSLKTPGYSGDHTHHVHRICFFQKSHKKAKKTVTERQSCGIMDA
jgi:hypothetical protein